MTSWLGIDVGGERKGFDAALIDEHRVLAMDHKLTRVAVMELVEAARPVLVGIDGPCCWAPEGETARVGERLLNRAVCGIRWTPDEHEGSRNDYYAWIRGGLALFDALRSAGVEAIEVFPTASWTRWHGPRGSLTRALWSRSALASLDLECVPARTNQDQRDAIAAAVTARQHTFGRTDAYGEILVPKPARPPERRS
jgi:predicted nuclease with RNAse H fold